MSKYILKDSPTTAQSIHIEGHNRCQKSIESAREIRELEVCHLNVSGFQCKIENGILDQFLEQYDIIFLVETNTESPILKDTALENFAYYKKSQT